MIQMPACFCTVSYQNNQTVFSTLVLCHTNMTQVSAFSCITTTCSICHQFFLCMIMTLSVSYLHDPVFSCTVPYLRDATVSLFCITPAWSRHQQFFLSYLHDATVSHFCCPVSYLHDAFIFIFGGVLSYLHDATVSLFLSCVILTWSHCQPVPVLCHTYMIPPSVFSCPVSYLHDPTVSLFLSCVILTWSHCQPVPVLCHTYMIPPSACSCPVSYQHDWAGSLFHTTPTWSRCRQLFFSLSHLCNQDVGSFSLCPTYMIESSAVSCPMSAAVHDQEVVSSC